MHAPRFDSVRPIRWDGCLHLLDQRALPDRKVWLRYEDAPAVAGAIRDMVVRGAPAIGIAAAFGVALAARRAWREAGEGWREAIRSDLDILAAARPTAVNLFWALARMRGVFDPIEGDPEPALAAEANRILEEDIAANYAIGRLGAGLIREKGAVLTHCNAGALATGGYGTALGVIRAGYEAGVIERVYADETRPWLQGARLTAWELIEDGIPVSLEADGAAAWLMRRGKIHWVIVGSDRIAANGDVANKIGTYGLAILARHHGVKFMVAAPTSTIDEHTPDGTRIPIEERAAEEVLGVFGKRYAPEGADAWNPVFDVTPAELVDAIVTEKGVVEKPDREKIQALMRR